MATTEAAAALAALDGRDVRALTRCMTVLDEHAPPPADAPGIYYVATESGGGYVVDPELGSCTCPDARYRDPDGGCQHVRRVRLWRGEQDVPAAVDPTAVDPELRERLDLGVEIRTPGLEDTGGEEVSR